MRHPLWIINSALLFLCIAVLCFIFFSQPVLPDREDIEPDVYTKKVRAKVSEFNIQQIYKNDLFDTYHDVMALPEEMMAVPAFPEPPPPRPMQQLTWPKPKFLEPLNIALKGIVVVVNDPAKNSAIIADRKTNREATYHIGDIIEDAQLLKIFSNKVIFLRANGQQEVIYLREKDAKRDPAYALLEGWQGVIQQIGVNTYQISPREFVRRIPDLAQFIDILDLTTVYQKGASIGCRIGRVAENSLGAALGLRSKDIVLAINDILVTDMPSRFQAYKQVIATESGQEVIARIMRDESIIIMHYKLEEFRKIGEESSPEQAAVAGEIPQAKPPATTQQIELLKKRHEFAPTMEEIRRRDRAHMLRNEQSRTKNITSHFNE